MTSGSNLVLAGFMGTGKTTVGQWVAARLERPFVDIDQVIIARAGKPIAAIFAEGGEAAFRALEAAACHDIAQQSQQVIATGGGALLNPAVRESLAASGLIICLTCDLDEIIRRVGDAPHRPLFTPDRDRLARLLADRAPLYNSLPLHVDTTHRDPSQIAEEVIRLWTLHI